MNHDKQGGKMFNRRHTSKEIINGKNEIKVLAKELKRLQLKKSKIEETSSAQERESLNRIKLEKERLKLELEVSFDDIDYLVCLPWDKLVEIRNMIETVRDKQIHSIESLEKTGRKKIVAQIGGKLEWFNRGIKKVRNLVKG